MICPPTLKAGDTVGIVATGRKVYPHDVSSALSHFGAWGLKVVLAPHLFDNEHAYLASSDEKRCADFQQMVDDREIKAIVCARGGYGTTRILDRLELIGLKEQPKWIVGFSDITALHIQLFQLGIQSIHGTMPILFEKSDPGSLESLRQSLFEGHNTLETVATPYNRRGASSGFLLGGNLSLLVDALGTRSEPDFHGALLIVEETDEHLYKIDRMFTQLRRAGVLERIRGLAVGHMSGMQDTTPGFGESVAEIILSKVSTYNYPVAFGFPTGHELPNLAWVHGADMALSVNEHLSTLIPVSSQ